MISRQETGRPEARAQGIVLMYHRVASPACDPWSLCVSPQRFKEHLEALHRLGVTLPLAQLSGPAADSHMPSVWVAITFDDGYADNWLEAANLLAQFEMPATFFLASGYLGSNQAFWWDELTQLLLMPGSLPSLAKLEIDEEFGIDGWGAQNWYRIQDFERDKHWRVADPDPSPRQTLYRRLHAVMMAKPELQRQEALQAVRTWAGRGPTSPSARVLTVEEAVSLAATEGVEAGAHTVTHCDLASLPVSRQAQEIVHSKQLLERMLGRAIRSFSYPYGRYVEQARQTVSLVQQAGFECAVTTRAGVVGAATDRFQLPRVAVRDWPGPDFEARLRTMLQTAASPA